MRGEVVILHTIRNMLATMMLIMTMAMMMTMATRLVLAAWAQRRLQGIDPGARARHNRIIWPGVPPN